MPSLITDDQGLPKPQYEDENGASFEAVKGKQGASFSYQKDGHNEALGSTTDAEDKNTLIGLTKNKRNILNTIKDTIANIKTRLDLVPITTDTMRVASVQVGTGALYGSLTAETTVKELRLGGAAKADRRFLQVHNTSETAVVYVGFTNAVTIANGIPVYPRTSYSLGISPGTGLTAFVIAEESVDIRIVEG